ncbi:MAG: urease accessory protein UreE [Pseudorhodoplanes sp.]
MNPDRGAFRAIATIRAGAPRSGSVRDTLLLDFEQRQGPDAVVVGLRGTQIEARLPGARLRTDDCLVLDDGTLVEIVAKPEPLLEVRAADIAALARLAFHLGDRHVPAELAARRLRVRRDAAIESLLRGLGAAVAAIEAPFEPEGGAYAHAAAADRGHAPHRHPHPDHTHDHAHGRAPRRPSAEQP